MDRGNPGRVIIRRAGRRRRHHFGGPQIRTIMPQRPRKPPTAFNSFIHTYFQTAMARNFSSTAESMRYAAHYWHTNPRIHAQYEAHVRTARLKFLRELAEYKRRYNVLKRPGNAYIIFARELHQNQGAGHSVREFGRIAGDAWRRMSRTERQPYIARAQEAKRRHTEMLRNIHMGRATLEQYLPPPVANGQAN